MAIHNIEKYSFRYFLLKLYMICWHDHIFYRKVAYVNREKIPTDEHLIFTPNHQNALMDALAIEFSMRNQFVFVARSDIFKNKWVASLLYFLKILPVYRIRDGYESLKKNEEIFNKTLDIIHNKNGFVIMPEGNHAGFRRLRPLRKGFARIAYQAEEASDFSLDIKLIPVGINYDRYDTYRSEVLVIFGEPVPVSEFYEDYKENPAKAYNKIKTVLAEKMKPLMIEIESEAYYEVYDALREMYEKVACRKLGFNYKNLYDKFRAHKAVIAALENEEKTENNDFKELVEKTTVYLNNMSHLKLDLHVFEKRGGKKVMLILKSLLLLIGLPFFVYGFINNAIPYFAPFILTGKVKDKQFHSSFKFVITAFLYPIYYFILTVVAFLITRDTFWTLTYLFSLPITGALAWYYSRLYLKTLCDFRCLKYKTTKNNRLIDSRDLYDSIMDLLDRIFQKSDF